VSLFKAYTCFICSGNPTQYVQMTVQRRPKWKPVFHNSSNPYQLNTYPLHILIRLWRSSVIQIFTNKILYAFHVSSFLITFTSHRCLLHLFILTRATVQCAFPRKSR